MSLQRRVFILGLLCLLCFSLAACSNAGHSNGPAPDASRPAPDTSLPAPASSAGQALISPGAARRELSFDDAAQFRYGRQYEDSLPQHFAARTGDAVQLWPEGAGLEQLAFCIYSFNLAGYDEEARLYFKWAQQPVSGSFSLALANWALDRWEWYSPASPDSLELPQLANYIDADGSCLLVIAISGLQPATLEQLSFGEIEGELQAPQILLVAPQGGPSGKLVRFSAQLEGSEELLYAWDFGAGATPGTSTEAQPQVTLGAEGSYPASLTVSNGLGSARYDFNLQVLAASNWTRSIGHTFSDSIVDVAAAPDGSVYAALRFMHFSSIMKLDSQGQLVWNRTPGGELWDAKIIELRLASDGSLLMAGNIDSDTADWNENHGGRGVLAVLDSAGQPAGYHMLADDYAGPIGSFDLAADGSMLLSSHDLSWLTRLDSSFTPQWTLGLFDPAPTASHRLASCFAADGAVWCAGLADFDASGTQRSFICRLDGNGGLEWARANLASDGNAPASLCALPAGAFLLTEAANGWTNQAGMQMSVFSAAGDTLFSRYRPTYMEGQQIEARFFDGGILVAGGERRLDSLSRQYFTALNAYSLGGEEQWSLRLIGNPDYAGALCLDVSSDGSVLLGGFAGSANVSLQPPAEAPLGGASASYSAATLSPQAFSLAWTAGQFSLADAPAYLVQDSGAGEEDGLLMKLDLPQ
ncbi:PKD domain-containing protein [bacterium]|nr:PKD domain-containing protein [bacterium]